MDFPKGAPGDEPVIVEGLLRAPLRRVYRAWTDPNDIVKWFGLKKAAMVSAEIDLRVGGRWCFVMEENAEGRATLSGEYLTVEPDARLAFSWRHRRENADGKIEETPISQVTVTFHEEGAATRIHLRHEGIARREGRQGVTQGWGASLSHLAELLESAEAENAEG